MPGAPGANSRGRGGKFRKFTRGGGKHFSRDLRPLDAHGNEISMWSAEAQRKATRDSEDEDSENSEDTSSDEDEDGGPSSKAAQSREDRKKEKKARKEAAIAKRRAQTVEVGDMPSSDEDEDEDESDSMPANPNHSKAARSQAKAVAAPHDVDDAADGIKMLSMASSRKERESAEAVLAKEKYRKLHEQGKTDEAKADLARLKLIREQRDAEAARRKAEKEEKEAQEAARKAEIEAKEAKKRAAAMGPGKKGKKAK